jgi:hypothetical protein
LAKTFKYRVCQMQMARVTYINGLWQGLQVSEVAAGADTVFNTCPTVWEYLESAGSEGWELVTAAEYAVSHGAEVSNLVNLLFLKKEVSSDW